MTSITPPRSSHSPCHRPHATTARKRALRTSGVEKWDVVMWNDQVHSSQESSTPNWHSSTLRSASDSTISDSAPRTCISKDALSLASTQSAPAPSTPCFATTASAFGFGTGTSTRPRPIRRKSSHEPAVQCHQTRLDALSALHRSVEEHDAGFLARMRELEERCHLLPDSLSVLRSSDLATPGASRGRKRGAASWDEDGDVEMSCWNERRTKHRSARSDSPVLFASGASTCDDKATHSDDEYVVADHDGTDSHSCSDDDEDEEDDDLDIVIVPGGSSAPSLAASSPSSLSTSLSSLPARAGTPPLQQYTPSTHIPGTIKRMDELAAAMAGGAGSVVEWSVSSDVPGDGSHFIADIAQAGALWA